MKKRMFVALVLTILVLTMAGSTSALAGPPPKTTGGVQFSMIYMSPDLDGNPISSRNWGQWNVVDHGGSAKGWYTWMSKSQYGWIRMTTKVDCATFFEDAAGVPTAVFVGEITSIQPPEPPEWVLEPTFWFYPGQFVKILAHDEGSPGWDGDQIGFYLDLDVPGGSASFASRPSCGPDGFSVSLPVYAGNLVVHD